jgi:hypothetical protein
MLKEKLKKIFSKIGLKLLTPYLVFSFFVFLLISVFVYYNYNSEMNFIEDSQQKMAESVSSEIDFFIFSTINDLQFVSKNIACLDCYENNSFLINNLFDVNSDIYSVHIFDRQKGITNDLHRYSKDDHSGDFGVGIFEDGKLLKGFDRGTFISPVYVSVYDLPFIFIGVPIFDEVNIQIGTVVAEVDLTFIWDVISRNKFKKTGYVYAVDVSQKPRLIAYKDISFLKSGYDVSGFVGVNNIVNHNHSFSVYESFDGKKVVGAWSSINSTNWGLLVELPVKEIFSDLFILLVISIISILLFVLLLELMKLASEI